MLARTPSLLFPLLSVLVGSLGVLAFLAMALALLQARPEVEPEGVQVQVELEGAPAGASVVPLECRADGALLHEGRRVSRFFPLERLRREAGIVRDLHDRGLGQAGGTLSRDQEWLFFKAVIERDPRLKDSLTLALHQIEMGNLKNEGRVRRPERYPVLLVYAEGMASYELVAFLLEATSRLPLAQEPMPSLWSVRPPPRGAAGAAASAQRFAWMATARPLLGPLHSSAGPRP